MSAVLVYMYRERNVVYRERNVVKPPRDIVAHACKGILTYTNV